MKMTKMMNYTLGLAAVLALGACGRSEQTSDIKIVGGTEVGEEVMDARRLSTVALTTDLKLGSGSPLDNGGSFCSGTIVGPRHIVTASHCLQAFDAGTLQKKDEYVLPEATDFIVAFGTHVSKDGHWVRAAEVIPHANWDVTATISIKPDKPGNDIGMVILSEDIPEGFQPAMIADTGKTVGQGEELIMAGYGITRSVKKNDTGILRQAEVPALEADNIGQRIVSGKWFEGVCSGDSGGPAYVKKDGQLYFTGIASTGAMLFGRWCIGIRNSHTDVRYYQDWINEKMASHR
jgi:secreted trypsin-like serine protease